MVVDMGYSSSSVLIEFGRAFDMKLVEVAEEKIQTMLYSTEQ